MGFYVSFAGNLTMKKEGRLKGACMGIPLNRILVETDSPFLVPQKARNKRVRRNEPVYVVEVIQKVAELRNLELNHVESQLVQNTMNCFTKLKELKSWSDLLATAVKGVG